MKVCSLAFVAGLLLLTLGCQPIRATTSATLAQPDAALSTTGTPVVPSAMAPLTSTVASTMTSAVTTSLPLRATAPVTATAAPLADGRTLYWGYYCGICHQSAGAGTTGTFGPSHDGLGAIAAQRWQEPTYQGDATTAAEYLHESLVDPQRFVVPGYELTPHRMPSYSFLPPAELAALVVWLQQQ